jgi:predicted Zn-dependent protease
MTTLSADELFDQGLERYKAGESIATLIPTFKTVCDRTKKNSSAFTCLAWLYLLNDQPALALTTAQKAVKLNPQDPQARVNLALALLDSGKKGVREHVEIAGQIMQIAEDMQEEVLHNIADGLTRKPDWKSMERVKAWLLD